MQFKNPKIKEKGKKVLKYLLVTIFSLYLLSRFMIPNPKFQDPTSTIVEDSTGILIGAKIATDGQWRFPASDSIPVNFDACILQFEDQYFYWHPGFNPVSFFRALRKNMATGSFKEGGSTITMQVARLLQRDQPRTVLQKIKELFIALHLEINYSKKEILNMYVSNAPFGGNVVGLEAASWRYFGRKSHELSWSEYASLAVLPNAPSLIFPGRNQEKLIKKRDRLLDKLASNEIITDNQVYLAKLESTPGKPLSLPNYASHLLERLNKKAKGKRTRTSISVNLQKRAQQTINDFIATYKFNEIHNAAAIIIDNRKNTVLAYVGNSTRTAAHANKVDIITAARSTGSIMKPYLYAINLTKGELLPKMLLADIPTHFAGFSPKNYYKTFDGAVHADEALYRSLNVPFVRMLQSYGVERFYQNLKDMGVTTLNKESDHYGLSLILGGAETTLEDLSNIYAGMSRALTRYNRTDEYQDTDYNPALINSAQKRRFASNKSILKAGALTVTFDALRQVNRPVSEQGWKSFGGTRMLAWKTGTSFGNKDAWAIGVTPEYTVGVWVGNGDGEGRTGLTGVTSAAPIMFSLYEMLPTTTWFAKAFDDMEEAYACRQSGYKASHHCPVVDTTMIPANSIYTSVCTNHITVHVTQDEKYQVNLNCENNANIKHTSWFILPPVQEWFYKMKSPLYKTLPPLRSDCDDGNKMRVMEWIYPKNNNSIYIPIELSGKQGNVVFEIAHRNPGKKIYWYLDGKYIGQTQDFHQLQLSAEKGWHTVALMDEDGNESIKKIHILSK